jgi:hypothetical protein
MARAESPADPTRRYQSPARNEPTVVTQDHISPGNDTFGTVPVMQVAVVVYDGVFDSGLAAILDVLGNAVTALGGRVHESPTWDVTMVGPAAQVRTGAGLLVAPKPLEHARTADLLVVPALWEDDPSVLIKHVAGDAFRPVRDLIAQARNRGPASTPSRAHRQDSVSPARQVARRLAGPVPLGILSRIACTSTAC